eukprot:64360_1
MGNQNNSRFKNSDGSYQISQMKQTHPFKYSSDKKQWLKYKFDKKCKPANNTNDTDIDVKDEKEPESLIIMSFNIWFGDENFEQRQIELVKILQDIKPDVFSFQEVTKKWLDSFTQIAFIQNTYMLTAIPEDTSTLNGYGVFIGAKYDKLNVLDLQICKLKSIMGRQLLSMNIQLKNTGETIWINDVHLESKNTTQIRIEQLEIIFDEYIGERMKQNESMLMGDFNFR